MLLAEAHLERLYVWLVDETIYQKHGECGSVLFLLAVETSWEDWKTFQNNLKIATTHKSLLI
jgi:hypothetical protein